MTFLKKKLSPLYEVQLFEIYQILKSNIIKMGSEKSYFEIEFLKKSPWNWHLSINDFLSLKHSSSNITLSFCLFNQHKSQRKNYGNVDPINRKVVIWWPLFKSIFLDSKGDFRPTNHLYQKHFTSFGNEIVQKMCTGLDKQRKRVRLVSNLFRTQLYLTKSYFKNHEIWLNRCEIGGLI